MKLLVLFALMGLFITSSLRMSSETLYSVPVSNFSAKIRMIIYKKKIEDRISFVNPSVLGGLKSAEYLKLNPQGKMPLYITDENYPIPESDTIARYIIDKYSTLPPSFIPDTIQQRTLSDLVCRMHDVYIGALQGAMYKAPGNSYSTFGTDRKAALNELTRQLMVLEDTIQNFASKYPSYTGKYLCGNSMCLADATLYPTMVFCTFMLPQFFGINEESFMGPNLKKWWVFMSSEVAEAVQIKEEIVVALESWKQNNRWDPILAEMKNNAI